MIYMWVITLTIIWFFWKLNFTSKQVVETGNVSKIVDFKDKPERFTVIIFVIGLLSVIAVFKKPAPQTPQEAVYRPAPVVDAKSDDEDVRYEVKSKIKAASKDPDTVQFRGVQTSKKLTSVACGEFNGKNSFGGYVGYRRFVGNSDNVFIEGNNDTNVPFQKVWDESC